MTAHLEARALACGRGRTQILADVDLVVERGRMVALVGPNGSGKTTLLRTLAGLSDPVAGQVLLDGTSVTDLTGRQRALAMALLSQHELPPADILVGELVSLGRLPHRLPWDRGDDHDLIESALGRVGLTHLAARPVDRLSGGELRRVLLARALAQDVDLLLLDEPTNHLDLEHQHDLLSTVRDLGVTVVTAIHDLDLAARYFDEVVMVHRGGLRAVGAPAEVLTPDLIQEVFGVAATPVRHPVSGRWHLLFDRLG